MRSRHANPKPTQIITLLISVALISIMVLAVAIVTKPNPNAVLIINSTGATTSSTTALTSISATLTSSTRMSTSSVTSTMLSGGQILTSKPSCVANPFAQQPQPEQCLYLPFGVFGNYHWTHRDLKYTVVFVDSKDQIMNALGSYTYSFQKWGSLPNPAGAQQSDAALIKSAVSAWSTAFAAAGQPNFFTFTYLPSQDPNSPADVDVYYYFPRMSSPPGPFTFMRQASPYKIGIVLSIDSTFYGQGDEVAKDGANLFKTAVHELGHGFGLGHECANDAFGLQYCFISHLPVPSNPNGYPSNTQFQFDDVMVQGLDYAEAITTLDTGTIFYEYQIWDAGGSVVSAYGRTTYYLLSSQDYRALYQIYGPCITGIPGNQYNWQCPK